MQMTPPLRQKVKSLLMKVNMRVKKTGLKLNIQKTKIMIHLVLSLDGKLMGVKMEVATDFIFLGSKITTDSDHSHEIKRRLLLGRKAMINLDSVIKCRDITANKVPYNQSYGFSSGHVQM